MICRWEETERRVGREDGGGLIHPVPHKRYWWSWTSKEKCPSSSPPPWKSWKYWEQHCIATIKLSLITDHCDVITSCHFMTWRRFTFCVQKRSRTWSGLTMMRAIKSEFSLKKGIFRLTKGQNGTKKPLVICGSDINGSVPFDTS